MKPNFHRHIPSDVNYEMNLHMHDLWVFDFKERGEKKPQLPTLFMLAALQGNSQERDTTEGSRASQGLNVPFSDFYAFAYINQLNIY